MKLLQKKKSINTKYVLILILVVLLHSCDKKDQDIYSEPLKWEVFNLAVIFPLSGSDSDVERYNRIVKLFEDNVVKSQHNFDLGIRFNIEWYDENVEDMSLLADALAKRKDLKAVIGPLRDKNIEILADELYDKDIPMFIMSPSEDLVRKYSCGTAGVWIKNPFLWSLCETDITQSQLLLSKISMSGGSRISLLSANNKYGETYNKWVPFQATELGLKMVENRVYSNRSELEGCITDLLNSEAEYIICALNDVGDARLVLEKKHAKVGSPKLLFTGSVLTADILSLGNLAEGMEGFSIYSSPNTGFHIAYKEMFGESPMPYESQFYDALLLSFIATLYCYYSDQVITMNEAIAAISDLPLTEMDALPESYDWGKGIPIWDHYNLREMVLAPIRVGFLPQENLLGASGNLKFSANTYTTLVQSTYINWLIYNGTPVVLDFVAVTGGRVSNYLAAWHWKNLVRDIFDENAKDRRYSDLKDKKAVLVCASEGWLNYRHQADILSVYQFLKKNGMGDENIILIMKDDIANNSRNLYPGVIRSSPIGENLYEDVELDYRIDDLKVDDIASILLGEKSLRLPVVLDSDLNDNVLFYWTGHGVSGAFNWLETGDKFTYDMFRDILLQMSDKNRYRKMLVCAEPCYSGSVVKAVEGVSGILGIASSDENESSFADNYDSELGVWMCDRFTIKLIELISKNKYINYNDLYISLSLSTLGSHVKIYNNLLFDNMYNNQPNEFFIYN